MAFCTTQKADKKLPVFTPGIGFGGLCAFLVLLFVALVVASNGLEQLLLRSLEFGLRFVFLVLLGVVLLWLLLLILLLLLINFGLWFWDNLDGLVFWLMD